MEKLRHELLDWLRSIALAVVIALIIKTLIFNTTYVIGNSMYPTLHEKDRLITNKVLYLFSEPKRGDIIILKAPDDPKKDYIKRIIAIEGDNVKIEDGKVYVNNELLDEEYIEKGIKTYHNVNLVVPKGEVFVLGDNRRRGASKDSRYFGTIPVKNIKGKANFRYFPFSKFGYLK